MASKIYNSLKFSFIVSTILFPIIFIVYYLVIIFNINSTKNIYKNVKNNGLVYCYGLVNDSLVYAENLDHINERGMYIKYFDSVLSNNNYNGEKFTSSSFIYGGPFYFKSIRNDSLLVEVYSIDTICWKIDEYIMYNKLTHKEPAPKHIQNRKDSLDLLYQPKTSNDRNQNFCYQEEVNKLPNFIRKLLLN